MLRTRTTLTTAAAAAAIALTAPAPAVAQQDLRSPDTRDVAPAVVAQQDLRSPDARDATRPVQEPAVRTSSPSPSDDFGWGDAGIGAAGILGLLLAIGGTGVLVSHRRREHGVPRVSH